MKLECLNLLLLLSGHMILAQVPFVVMVIRRPNAMSLSATQSGELDFDGWRRTRPYTPVALEGASFNTGQIV